MWNHIRGPPYTGQSGNRPELFSGGFQSQYILESQLAALMCKSFMNYLSFFLLYVKLNNPIQFLLFFRAFSSIFTDAISAVSFVTLVTKIPLIQNEVQQRVATFLCIGLFVTVYSLLLRIFRIKNGGYPFKLLF